MVLKVIHYLSNEFANIFIPAAGAGAAENRGGTREHPRVCEDEEQPAQDPAGGRRRGANHLKLFRE